MKKVITILILIAVIAFGAAALIACEKPTDSTGVTGESAIAFDGEGSPFTVDAAALADTYGFSGIAQHFEAAAATSYNNVGAAAFAAYLEQYAQPSNGWALLSTVPRVYSKNNTAVLIYYADGTLTVATCFLKDGGVAALKDLAVTYSYSITNPTKTEFALGEDLDLAGFKVTRTGSDNSSIILAQGADYTIDTSSYNKNATGSYTFPVRIIGISDFSGNVAVSVFGEPLLSGGSADTVSKTYSDGVEAKLAVTPPTNTTGVTVSYSVKGEGETDFGEWTEDEPVLYTVGRLYIKVKFTKTGYADEILGGDGGLYIEINAAAFGNAESMTITSQTSVFDNTAKTAPYSFTVPSGAELSFSADNKATWSPTQPSFTNAGEYTVYFKVAKANYLTVERSYTVTIEKAEIDGVSCNYSAYIFRDSAAADGEYLSMLTGTVAGDVVSYSTDNGASFVSAHPGSDWNGNTFKVKIERGNNHQIIFTQKLVAIKSYETVDFSPSHSLSLVPDSDNLYVNLSASGASDVLVRISSDGGETYGAWRDAINDIPYFERGDAGTFKHEFLIISGAGSQSYFCDLVLPYKEITGLAVKTAPAKLKYLLGETLDLTGLVLTATYDDDSTADLAYDELPDVIRLQDSDLRSIAHGTVLNNRYATGSSIRFDFNRNLPILMSGFYFYVYDIDEDLPFEDGSEISFGAYPTITDYAPGEGVDLTGLVVKASFPSALGAGVFVTLPLSRYETDAESVDMSVGGPVMITVTGLDDGSGSAPTAQFRIYVDYPFKGTTWYDSEGPAYYRLFTILDNQNAIYYEHGEDSPAEALDATYETYYDAEENGFTIAISYAFDESNYVAYFYYDAASEEMFAWGSPLSMLLDTDVVIAVKLYLTEDDAIYFEIVAANGLIPEATLEILAIYGELYFTDGIDENELVPSGYQFTEWVLIYCLFDQQDYTGAPFIGYFESENDLIYISGTSFSAHNSGKMFYKAVEDDGTWTITFGLHLGVGLLSLIYDTSSGEMIAYVDGEAVSTYTRVSAELFAIVTLATEDETLREYSGFFYKIEKGTAFPAFKYQNGSLISFVYANYSGGPITEDTTLYIEAVDYFDAGSDDVYGTFERNFKFNFDAMLVTVKEGLTVIGGYAFEITSFEDGILSITSALGGFSGYLGEYDYNMCFVIESGTFAGGYQINAYDFYAGLPFIEVAFNDSDSYINLYPYGRFDAYFTDEYLYGSFVVTGIDGNTYSLEFTDDYGITYSGSYDGDARTLVFNDLYTLEAPPIYLGRYSYQDKFIGIYDVDSVSLPELNGEIESVETADGVTTITIQPWEPEAATVTIIYNHANDTVTWGGNTYTRCTDYSAMPFAGRIFTEETDGIEIDGNGKLFLNGNMIGEITDLDENAKTFTVVYFDGATPSMNGCSYTDTQIIIGEVTYVYSDEYADLPFTQKVYRYDSDSMIRIAESGKVYVYDSIVGYITDVDETELTFTVVYFDEGTPAAEGSYDEAADEFTIGGVVYVFYYNF